MCVLEIAFHPLVVAGPLHLRVSISESMVLHLVDLSPRWKGLAESRALSTSAKTTGPNESLPSSASPVKVLVLMASASALLPSSQTSCHARFSILKVVLAVKASATSVAPSSLNEFQERSKLTQGGVGLEGLFHRHDAVVVETSLRETKLRHGRAMAAHVLDGFYSCFDGFQRLLYL